MIALTAYTLQIIYRNIVAGLANVPADAKDAGRGMGMTERQLLWQVELPLAVPEIIAGLRIATVSTVAIATLAVLRRRRRARRARSTPTSPSRPTSSSRAASRSLMAIAFDVVLLRDPAAADPWQPGEARS